MARGSRNSKRLKVNRKPKVSRKAKQRKPSTKHTRRKSNNARRRRSGRKSLSSVRRSATVLGGLTAPNAVGDPIGGANQLIMRYTDEVQPTGPRLQYAVDPIMQGNVLPNAVQFGRISKCTVYAMPPRTGTTADQVAVFYATPVQVARSGSTSAVGAAMCQESTILNPTLDPKYIKVGEFTEAQLLSQHALLVADQDLYILGHLSAANPASLLPAAILPTLLFVYDVIYSLDSIQNLTVSIDEPLLDWEWDTITPVKNGKTMPLLAKPQYVLSS